MKKKIKQLQLIILTLLVVIMVLVGYIVYNKYVLSFVFETKVTKTTNKKKDNYIKFDSRREYVYDAPYQYFNQQILNNLKIENDPEHSNNLLDGIKTIAVPYLNFNTSDAININYNIYKLFDDKMKQFQGIAVNNNNQSLELFLNYVKYYTKKHVSVVIVTGDYVSNDKFTTYYGYVFNLKTGNVLSIEDIAKEKDLTLEELETKTRDAIQKYTQKQDEKLKIKGVYTNRLNETFDQLNQSISNQGKVDKYTSGVVYYIDDYDSIMALVNIYIDGDDEVETCLVEID